MAEIALGLYVAKTLESNDSYTCTQAQAVEYKFE